MAQSNQTLFNGEPVDVFKADKKTVDTQKVTFAIWRNRKNAAFIRDFTEIISKFIDEKRVFNEIEFYLPQIAHMIIHLDVDWTVQSLERFAVVISQVSIHTSLQLCFILVAAMEDYQPENADGKRNPKANPEYFFRCARLLQNIERAVVFGSPTLTAQEEENLVNKLTAVKLLELKDYERNERADQIIRKNDTGVTQLPEEAVAQEGNLLYKRAVRKSRFHSKGWKTRYFKIDQRVLLCFHDKEAREPLRATPLTDCEVFIVQREKYQFQFDLVERSSQIRYHLRAQDQAEMNSWMNALRREASRPPAPVIVTPLRTPGASAAPSTDENESTAAAGGSAPVQSMSRGALSTSQLLAQRDKAMQAQDMTSGQKKRFKYFQQQRVFLKRLTDICERLRFMDREVRKHFLRKDMADLVIPPFCYLPLCRSVDPWRYVLRALPNEAHAFTTKARCPALMLFEVEEHPEGLDVATFLSSELHEFREQDLVMSNLELAQEASEKSAQSADGGDDDHLTAPLAKKDSLLSLRPQAAASSHTGSPPTRRFRIGVWRLEGTGINRLRAAGSPLLNQLNLPKNSAVPMDPSAIADAAAEGYPQSPGLKKAITLSANNSPQLNARKTAPRGSLSDGQTQTEQNGHSEATTTAASGRGVGSVAAGGAASLMNGETFSEKAARIRASSPYGHLSGWKLDGLIAKSNDDLRQEAFVMQLIVYYQIAFQVAKIPVWLYTYRILSTSKTTGLIQLIPDAVSLDGLKKRSDFPGSLRKYFENVYGLSPDGSESPALKKAIGEFVKSLAGYSIVSYLLAIKDRHNGNVMIDAAGHLIHIDFGFVFGLAPGKQFSMEKAPWKLNEEWVAVMGGRDSAYFQEYLRLCVEAFLEARRHSEAVITLMDIMFYESNFPAFKYNPNAIRDFRQRMALTLKDDEVPKHIEKLIDKSYKHAGTDFYDSFQLATNGIAK